MKHTLQLNTLAYYEQLLIEATHISGSIIDHVYVNKNLLDEYHFKLSVHCVFLTDHDITSLSIRKYSGN